MVRYVIFDMDGTLLDSERFYFEGFQSILSRKGMEFKEENFRHVIGNEDRDTEKYLQGVYGNDFHFSEALAELDRMEEARIRQGDAIPVRLGYEHLAAVLRKKTLFQQLRHQPDGRQRNGGCQRQEFLKILRSCCVEMKSGIKNRILKYMKRL